MILLLNYQNDMGIDTVSTIARRYAPAHENDTKKYTAALCTALKVRPTDTVNLSNPAVMRKLVQTITRLEHQECSEIVINEGMRRAGMYVYP